MRRVSAESHQRLDREPWLGRLERADDLFIEIHEMTQRSEIHTCISSIANPCSGSICGDGSVAVDGMPIQEGGQSLRNCLWTLKLQEVSGALNGAIFHLRKPGTQQHGDLHP